MWIAQFSDRSTLHASRLCLSYTQWPFHPGLYIQVSLLNLYLISSVYLFIVIYKYGTDLLGCYRRKDYITEDIIER